MATRRKAQTDDERRLCLVALTGKFEGLTELLDKGVFVDVFVCSTPREDFQMERNKNAKQAKWEDLERLY